MVDWVRLELLVLSLGLKALLSKERRKTDLSLMFVLRFSAKLGGLCGGGSLRYLCLCPVNQLV